MPPTAGVFFIATAHDHYRERKFPAGSVVIDPWRIIPDQAGVTVRRLGQNRPAMISLLVPSRGRPEAFDRMYESVFQTATYPNQVEVICWHDDDDETRWAYPWPTIDDIPLVYIQGERRLLSDCWNECAKAARGEILMHCGDDIVFETPGWDIQVRQAFEEVPDKILLVQGDDLSPNREALATHGFVHRRWVDAVGYFLPPLFSCDWNDVWLTEVADMIGRRRILPFVTEHQHYSFEKRQRDQTDIEREQRGLDDDVVALYKNMAHKRRSDAAKLRKAIAA